MGISSQGKQTPNLALEFSNILCCEQQFPIYCLRSTRGLDMQLPAQARYPTGSSNHVGLWGEGMKAGTSCVEKHGPIPCSGLPTLNTHFFSRQVIS